MPALAQYVLRVSGRLEGEKSSLGDSKAQFDEIFKRPDCSAKDRDSGEGWPQGVWLPDYDLCHWHLAVETPKRDPSTTLFDFRTEINRTKEGQLYDNRKEMLLDVDWFYNSVEKKWNRDLKEQLMGFNDRWKQLLLCRLWFCEWRWYCGNGGY